MAFYPKLIIVICRFKVVDQLIEEALIVIPNSMFETFFLVLGTT